MKTMQNEKEKFIVGSTPDRISEPLIFIKNEQ